MKARKYSASGVAPADSCDRVSITSPDRMRKPIGVLVNLTSRSAIALSTQWSAVCGIPAPCEAAANGPSGAG